MQGCLPLPVPKKRTRYWQRKARRMHRDGFRVHKIAAVCAVSVSDVCEVLVDSGLLALSMCPIIEKSGWR